MQRLGFDPLGRILGELAEAPEAWRQAETWSCASQPSSSCRSFLRSVTLGATHQRELALIVLRAESFYLLEWRNILHALVFDKLVRDVFISVPLQWAAPEHIVLTDVLYGTRLAGYVDF